LGGSIGIALSANAVARFSAQARAALSSHLPANDPGVVARLDAITKGLLAGGAPPAVAHAGALGTLAREVQRQALMLSFERIVILFGVACLLAFPPILSRRWRRRAAGRVEAHWRAMSRAPLNIALAIAAVLLLAAGGSWLVDRARAPAPRTRLPATVPANARRVTLAVSGMMCARCSERVANPPDTTSALPPSDL